MALAEAAKEAIWLNRMLQELGFINKDKPTQLYCDNQGALALAGNPAHHKGTAKSSGPQHAILGGKGSPSASVTSHVTMRQFATYTPYINRYLHTYSKIIVSLTPVVSSDLLVTTGECKT
jgi:hypothetical protein